MPTKLPAHIRVLRKLVELERDHKDATLTQEGVRVYIGESTEQTSAATINNLLRCCAISIAYQGGNYKIWALNGFGHAIARRPVLADEIAAEVSRRRRPFTIGPDDRIKYLK